MMRLICELQFEDRMKFGMKGIVEMSGEYMHLLLGLFRMFCPLLLLS